MSKRLSLMALLFTLLLQLSAVGVGMGAEYGFGWGDETKDRVGQDEPGQFTMNKHRIVFMMVDTHVGPETIFAYRMKFGVGKTDYSRDVNFDDRFASSSDFFHFNQTLGFAFLRREKFKLWAGPSLTLESHNYKDDDDVGLYGVGVSLGSNVMITPNFAISLELGYDYEYNFEDTMDSMIRLSLYTIFVSSETKEEK